MNQQRRPWRPPLAGTMAQHPLRVVLFTLVGIIAIAAAAAAIAISQFDPNTLKPRIVEAVKRATGRDLTLNGNIGLIFSLTPTIRLTDVSLANPADFSRPQMVTVQALQVQVALLPLLSRRIEIDRLLLIHPDILLETTASGQSNWHFARPTARTAPAIASSPATPAPPTPRRPIRIEAIRIQDGTLAWRDDATGSQTTVTLPVLEARSAAPDAPLHLDADALYDGAPFTLTADTGSLDRLRDEQATTPWPVRLTLTVGQPATPEQAKLTAEGSLTRPLQAKGYHLAIDGTVPDFSTVAPLLHGLFPPLARSAATSLPLHDVTFAANVTDTGAGPPDLSTLKLHVGASDFSTLRAGLMLDRLDVDAPRADQPMHVAAAVRVGDTPLSLAATLGPPSQLLTDATPAPFPVDIGIQAAGATAAAKGVIAEPRSMTGASLALSAQIPDLSALSPFAGRPLPPIRTLTFQATLNTADTGGQHGAALQGIALTSPDADLSGDATIALGARPSLTAALHSNRVDMDAEQAAIDQTPAAAPPPAAAANTAPSAAPPAHHDQRLFSGEPIPFDLLRATDADLKLTVADLHTGGVEYRAIDIHAVLSAGKLTIDPFAADLPEGHLSGTLSTDATQPAPPVHVVLHAPGLALRSVLAAFHQPSYATGNLEVYADLTASGETRQAIVSTLNGSLGLAMAGGTIDNRLLGSLLGKVMDSLNALNLVGRGGTSALKCFGLRMDARHGIAAIRSLALSSSLLTMTGMGTVNLGAETVAMALRPQARIAGAGLVIPIAVSGPLRDPVVRVNDLAAAEANAGTVAEAVIGDATPLGIVGGLLGADKLFGLTTADICPAALAAARGQPVPEARTAKPTIANPEAFLKNLFR